MAVAGNQIKPGTNKKVTAPLEWNFVAEKQGETKKNIVPSIGPILPGKPQETNSKPKARYVPPDISRYSFFDYVYESYFIQSFKMNFSEAAEALVNIITADKCDVCR